MKTHWTSFLVVAALLVGCQSPTFNNPLAHRAGSNLRQPPAGAAASGQSTQGSLTASARGSATSAAPSVNELLSQGHSAFLQADRLERENRRADAQRLYAQAKSFYQQVLQRDPKNATAHHRLAVIADKQGDFRTAETHYLAAISADPNNADLLNDLGYSYLLQGRYAEAERYLQSALQHNPAHPQAINNLGLLYAKRGEYQRALAMFRRTGSETEARRKLAQLLPPGQTVDQVLAQSSAAATTNGPPASAWPQSTVPANALASQRPAGAGTQTPAQPTAVGSGWPAATSGRSSVPSGSTASAGGVPSTATGLRTTSGTANGGRGGTGAGQPSEQTLRLRALMDAARQRSLAQRERKDAAVSWPTTAVGGTNLPVGSGWPSAGTTGAGLSTASTVASGSLTPAGSTPSLGSAAAGPAGGSTVWNGPGSAVATGPSYPGGRYGSSPTDTGSVAALAASQPTPSSAAGGTSPAQLAGPSGSGPSAVGGPTALPSAVWPGRAASSAALPSGPSGLAATSPSALASSVPPVAGSSLVASPASTAGFGTAGSGSPTAAPDSGPSVPNAALNVAGTGAVAGTTRPADSLPLWPPSSLKTATEGKTGAAGGASAASGQTAVSGSHCAASPSALASSGVPAAGGATGAAFGTGTAAGELPGAGLNTGSTSGPSANQWARQAAELGMQVGPGQMFPLSPSTAPSVLPGTNSKLNGAQFPQPKSWPAASATNSPAGGSAAANCPAHAGASTAIQQASGLGVSGFRSLGLPASGTSAASGPSALSPLGTNPPSSLSASPSGTAAASGRTAAADPLAEYEQQIRQQNEERLRLQQMLDARRQSVVTPPQWPYSARSGQR